MIDDTLTMCHVLLVLTRLYECEVNSATCCVLFYSSVLEF
jgi:hypothetical protein